MKFGRTLITCSKCFGDGRDLTGVYKNKIAKARGRQRRHATRIIDDESQPAAFLVAKIATQLLDLLHIVEIDRLADHG